MREFSTESYAQRVWMTAKQNSVRPRELDARGRVAFGFCKRSANESAIASPDRASSRLGVDARNGRSTRQRVTHSDAAIRPVSDF